MATSCISTTTDLAQSKMYPWRRSPSTFTESVNEASIMKPLDKKLSAEAPEFVPRWARKENIVPATYNVGDCFQISLDCYSDDDEPVSTVTLPKATTTHAETPPKEVAPVATPKATATDQKEEPMSDEKAGLLTKEKNTGIQRPWRVSKVSEVQTAEIASGSSLTSIVEPKSKFPWRCGSIGQQARSHTAPAAKLPPWKRAAWKPPSTHEDDEVCSKSEVPEATLGTPSSSATTNSGASMSTIESDADASEDSVDDDTTAETRSSIQEQEASVDEETTADTPETPSSVEEQEAAGEDKSIDDTSSGLEEQEALDEDQSPNDTSSGPEEPDASLGTKSIDEVTNGSEEQEASGEDKMPDGTPGRSEGQETSGEDKSTEDTPGGLGEQEVPDEEKSADDTPLGWEEQKVSGDDESTDDTPSKSKEQEASSEDKGTDDKPSGLEEPEALSEAQSADDTPDGSEEQEVEKKDFGTQEHRMNSESHEHKEDDTKEKLIAERDNVSSGDEDSTCETEPEAEEDIPQSRVSSCNPEEDVSHLRPLSVLELLKWRSALDSDEVSAHGIPGRLIASTEPTEQPCQPQSPLSRTSWRRKKNESVVAAPQTSSPPVISSHVLEERCTSRSETLSGVKKSKFQASENSWMAKQRARRGQSEGSDEEVVRAMKSILNKLTLEKFPQLYQQMISCGIRTVDHLDQLIQEVFEKATTQHHFIDMYADFCAQLNMHFTTNPIVDSPKTTFKHILLNACQASFEKNLLPPANLASLSPEERTAAEFEYKMRTIGNIRLVGALLVRKMLASKVMFAIIEELLGRPTPEALETLAALLTVVGGEFDKPNFVHRVPLNAIFCQVQTLAKKSTTPSRVRCLLKDVLDLRASGWLDKKPKKMEKPTTLEEVHQKAAIENGCPIVSMSRPGLEARTTVPQKSAGVEPIPSLGSPSKLSNSQKLESSFSKKPTKLPVKEAPKAELSKESFDHKSCQEEIARALAELFVSYDIPDALYRVAEIGVPNSHQAAELCNILAITSEQGSSEKRKIGFNFVAKLFLGKSWNQAALADGLRSFIEDMCAELKFDVPALPQICREELHPALVPAVEAGLLLVSEHQVLATAAF